MTNAMLLPTATRSGSAAAGNVAAPYEPALGHTDDLIAAAMQALTQARRTSRAASRDSIAVNAILW